MSMNTSTKQFFHHVASSYPIIWVDTDEYERCITTLRNSVKQIGHNCFKWDFVTGITEYNGNSEQIKNDTAEDPLVPIVHLLDKAKKSSNIMFAQDFHLFIKSEQIWRTLLNSLNTLRSTGNIFVIISPVVDIPVEIKRYVTVLDFSLPSKDELSEILDYACKSMNVDIPDDVAKNEILNCGTGLAAHEFENAIYHSMTVNNKQIVAGSVHEQKRQLIRKNSAMEVVKSDTGFEMLAGLENLKQFVPKMVGKPDAKGILVVGVPGAGKSAFAKALGKETGRMNISLDIGALQGGIVGDTERNTNEAFKIIDNMEPAILFIDEMEKSIAISNGAGGDSGVSKRQGGAILRWLNDHTSDVYTIATCNNIDGLPPEFLRAERWDAIFFVDLPNEAEREAILNLYKNHYGIESDEDVDINGWTGAEIKNLCKLAKNLDTSLKEASKYVCPISKTAAEKIDTLRAKLEGRTVPASIPMENISEQEQNNSRKVFNI